MMSQSSPDLPGGGPPSPADPAPIVDRRPAGREAAPVASGPGGPASAEAEDGPSWAEALLEAEGPVLLRIGSARPPGEVLEALCLMAEALCPGTTGAVLLLDEGGRVLRRGAGPSLPPAYRAAVEEMPVGRGCGSSWAAIESGEPAVSDDLAADPAWAGLAAEAVAHGLRACLSTPFRSAAGAVLGTFELYLREPRPPSPRELRVARRAAKLAAIAVERHRADEGYRRIVETADEGIWQTDALMRTTFANAKLAGMLGYAPDELIGRPALDLIFPEDVDEAMGRWQHRLQGERGVLELRLRRKDGSELWAHCAISPVYEPDGRFGGALGMVTDVTERRRVEAALRESEQRFRQMAENIQEVFWMSDPRKDRVHYVSPAYEAIWGRTCRSLYEQPRSFFETIHPEDRERVRAGSLERQGRGEPSDVEYRVVRPDGSVRWVRDRSFPVEGPSGSVDRVVGLAEDITGRKEAEEALRESEARLRAFYDNSPVLAGIVELTGDGDILHVDDNPETCRYFGVEPGSTAGRRASELGVSREATALWVASYRESERRGGPVRFEFATAGGHRWLSVTVCPIGVSTAGRRRYCYVAEDVTDSRRAQERLQRSEQRYRSLVTATASIVWDTPASGEFEAEQPGWSAFTGQTFDELKGWGWLDAVHPEDRAETTAVWSRAIEGRAIYQVEHRLRRADGEYRHMSVRAVPILGDDGSVREWVGVHNDVTERRLAEDAVRESEGRFRHLADAMPQIVWMGRPDHSIEYINRRWLDYTGQTAEQALGPGGWRGALHPDDLGRVLEASARSHDTGEPFEAEYRLRHRSGAYRWFLGRAVPVHDEAGRELRRFGTATDIDDRKRAEGVARFLADASAALTGSVDYEETLRRVAGMAVPAFADWCAVDIAGPGGRLRRLAVTHPDPERLRLAHELFERYPPRADDPRGIGRVLRTGEPELVEEITDELLEASAQDAEHLRLARALGPRSYVCVPLRPRGGSPGVLTFVTAGSGRQYHAGDLRVAEDVARRATVAIENAELYRALREADRRKGEFLATLAHELRNPLAPVRNAARLLASSPAVVAEARAEVEMIGRQVAHLARLVDDLMDVARIERGKIALRREVVELAAVVGHAVEAVRAGAEARGHELTVSLPEEPVRLKADPTRLEQVLDNLLTNAIKYTEPGGRIMLSAGLDGDEAVLRVRDTGIGIPPEKVAHIFEMFVQAEHRADRSEGGLGIGLGLVRSLVELHGGTVAVHSPGPGGGSEFVVRLPALTASPGPAEPSPGRRAGGVSAARRRILVVDDNVDAANSLAKVLSRLYAQDVRVAHHGAEALAVAEQFRPELVLLDIGMPGMDGYEVARRLRASPEAGGALLVALTGWGQDTDREKSRAAGFDRHLVKPVDPEVLRSLLASPGPGEPEPASAADPMGAEG